MAYYLVGLPLACFLGFKLDMGVMGLQAGAGLAIVLQLVTYAVILRCSNWKIIAD